MPFCVSLVGNGGAENFRHVDLSPMDCIETHIWLGLNQAFAVPSGLDLLLLESMGKLQPNWYNAAIEKWAQAGYYACSGPLLDWLSLAMDSWVALGNRHMVPVYTTVTLVCSTGR